MNDLLKKEVEVMIGEQLLQFKVDLGEHLAQSIHGVADLLKRETKEAIIDTIKITVNGRIDKLRESLDKLSEKQESDRIVLKDFIQKASPTLEVVERTKWGGKILLVIIGAVATIGGIYATFFK